MQQIPHQRKTLTERVIHAITFEGLATLILAPTAAWADAALGRGDGRAEYSARHPGDGMEHHL